MRDLYYPGVPAPDDDDRASELQELEDEVLERQLLAVLGELNELVATIEEEQADDEPLAPEQIAALEAVSGGDDAPLAFRSINRRVREGRLTWVEFWEHPDDQGQDGVNLLFAALGQLAAELPDQIAAARKAAGLTDLDDATR